MGGLFDLLFLGLILWWIFRAFGGGARRGGEEAEGGAPPEGLGAGRRGAEESEWRRRLREAVQEWEAEQRRRGGEPVPRGPAERTKPHARPVATAEVETRPAPRRTPPLEASRPDGRRGDRPDEAIREVHVTPPLERVGARLPELGAEIGGAGAPIGERREVGEIQFDDLHRPPRRRRRRAEAGEARKGRPAAERSRQAGARLPAFSRRGRLQRAILWSEILGPPRAISDRPWRDPL